MIMPTNVKYHIHLSSIWKRFYNLGPQTADNAHNVMGAGWKVYSIIMLSQKYKLIIMLPQTKFYTLSVPPKITWTRKHVYLSTHLHASTFLQYSQVQETVGYIQVQLLYQFCVILCIFSMLSFCLFIKTMLFRLFSFTN